MTYHELVQYVKEKFAGIDASGFEGHAAYQFNVRGNGEGAFYIEIQDGKIFIEPYEYYDRDVIFTMDTDVLVDIADGKLDVAQAVSDGSLSFTGNTEKAVAFGNLLAAGKNTVAADTKAAEVTADEVKPAEEIKSEAAAEKPARKKTSSATKKSCTSRKSTKKK